MKANNGNEIKDYDKIPITVGINLPGIYCKNCGETFALYPFSVVPMDGTDENKKPFYNNCFKCVSK